MKTSQHDLGSTSDIEEGGHLVEHHGDRLLSKGGPRRRTCPYVEQAERAQRSQGG